MAAIPVSTLIADASSQVAKAITAGNVDQALQWAQVYAVLSGASKLTTTTAGPA